MRARHVGWDNKIEIRAVTAKSGCISGYKMPNCLNVEAPSFCRAPMQGHKRHLVAKLQLNDLKLQRNVLTQIFTFRPIFLGKFALQIFHIVVVLISH